jgi:hypothetical protein
MDRFRLCIAMELNSAEQSPTPLSLTQSLIAEQIVTAQLEQLSHVSVSTIPPVEAILEAFLFPPLHVVMSVGEQSLYRARFMGRCRTEPDPVQSIAKQEFHASKQSFLDVLQRSLPEQSRTEPHRTVLET